MAGRMPEVIVLSDDEEEVLSPACSSTADHNPENHHEEAADLMPSGEAHLGVCGIVHDVDATGRCRKCGHHFDIHPATAYYGPAQVVAARAATSLHIPEWYFTDPGGYIQGPFTINTLKRWKDEGFFPPTLSIWSTRDPTHYVYLNELLNLIFPR